MKTHQSLRMLASGLMAGFTVSLFSLFYSYADWLSGGKKIYIVALFIPALFLCGCEKEKISQHAVTLSVDFTWKGLRPCDWGNPEIHVSGVPENTKSLQISMYDHAYSHDHGTVQMSYVGEKIIKKDRFKEIQRPCPVYTPGRYEITIKALDQGETIIGLGSKVRRFPEEE